MSLEPGKVSEENSGAGLGSLRGCLVEGDAEQRRGARRVRRRALIISIALQTAFLAALILVPLFGKTQRIAFAYATPVPPYSPYRNAPANPGAPRPHPNGPQNPCHFCAPHDISPTIVTRELNSSGQRTDNSPPEGIGDGPPGAPDGLIPLGDARQRVLPPASTERPVTRPRVVQVTNLDPAMLIHRVEPLYPALARQIHKEGRVELRAIIGTDGSIQSLQIVTGDPLFDLSAKEAVAQWRYRPTILNGQPVEIDTYITVVYTMQH